MTLDEALATVAGLERYAGDTQSEDALIEAGKVLRAEVARLTAELEHINAVCTHKTHAHERAVEREQAVLAERNRLTAELAALADERDRIAGEASRAELRANNAHAGLVARLEIEREAHAKTRAELDTRDGDVRFEKARADSAESVLAGMESFYMGGDLARWHQAQSVVDQIALLKREYGIGELPTPRRSAEAVLQWLREWAKEQHAIAVAKTEDAYRTQDAAWWQHWYNRLQPLGELLTKLDELEREHGAEVSRG